MATATDMSPVVVAMAGSPRRVARSAGSAVSSGLPLRSSTVLRPDVTRGRLRRHAILST
jgi:hypothetical protein